MTDKPINWRTLYRDEELAEQVVDRLDLTDTSWRKEYRSVQQQLEGAFNNCESALRKGRTLAGLEAIIQRVLLPGKISSGVYRPDEERRGVLKRNYGDLLSDLMEEQGVDDYQVAAHSGVSNRTLMRIRTGKCNRSHAGTIRRLAEYFDVSVNHFYERKP